MEEHTKPPSIYRRTYLSAFVSVKNAPWVSVPKFTAIHRWRLRLGTLGEFDRGTVEGVHDGRPDRG